MSRPLRIAIVEDEAVILMQLEMLLEEAGHQVVGTAMVADDAIELIRDARPELVLLDVHLQNGSSGLEVARAVRSLDDVTIVFLTANTRKLSDDMDGAIAAIAKPFSERVFTGSIAYLEECLHRPPPRRNMPIGMQVAPAYLEHFGGHS